MCKASNNKGIIYLLYLASFFIMIIMTSCGENESSSVGIHEDREGNVITLPDKVERIISIGPSNTQILSALGFGDKIIATDTYSEGIEGILSDIPLFSMLTPDGEQIIHLQPDVVFITGISKASGEDPFKVVKDAGICVIYIPTSNSIEGIKEDIRFIGNVVGAKDASEELITQMEQEIDAIKKIGDGIADKKTVHFEVSAAPYIYTTGNQTFIHEMIEIIGAENAFADQEDAWFSVSEEAVLHVNPDVILTSVDYIENPIDEILNRSGWNEITAVKNGAVYYIDTDSSNQPSHTIIKALKEMAVAVYPEEYGSK